MNVLLLGNGFDLYHKLPTKYDNFINTINFLIDNYAPTMETVGEIFGNKELQHKDKFIEDCFNQHEQVYKTMAINNDEIEKVITKAKNNKWYNFLCKSFDNKTSWIDFEKEISYVVGKFQKLLEIKEYPIKKEHFYSAVGSDGEFVIKNFSSIIDNSKEAAGVDNNLLLINKDFLKEYPLASKNWQLNKEKIIKLLINDFEEFKSLLIWYLQVFVENSLSGIQSAGVQKLPIICNIDRAITFNYTSTYEKLYLDNSIFHVHGKLKEKIVLGINSDYLDDEKPYDTTLVQFKKYFQCAQYGIDLNFINAIKYINDFDENVSLVVMGHSLDITDKEIIDELFYKMDEITILFHNEEAKNMYIENIIKMLGRYGLTNLRKAKKLSFLSLDMDFTDFNMQREKNTFEEAIKNMIIKNNSNK